MITPRYNLFIYVLIVMLIAFLTGCGMGPANAPVSSSVKTLSTISGGAWVRWKNGNSTVLRGLNVSLCSEATAAAIKTTRDSGWDEFLREHPGHSSSDWYYFRLAMALDEMEAVAEHDAKPHSISVKTGINGKYSIQDVPQGSYYLFAQTRNNYSAAYWLVPVVVDGDKAVHVDLDNSNMAEVYNAVQFGDQ
jgi:hypothetical protein